MRKILVATALLMLSAVAAAQLTIPGTKVKFELDNDAWIFVRTLKMTDGADLHLYCYTGEVFTDEGGDTVVPYLRIYVNSHFDGDLYELVYNRYLERPYQSLEEYSKGPGLPKSGGLGYEGIYTNPRDHKDYRFMMTYFQDKKTMVEFRLETTVDTYDEMEPLFRTILNSVQ